MTQEELQIIAEYSGLRLEHASNFDYYSHRCMACFVEDYRPDEKFDQGRELLIAFKRKNPGVKLDMKDPISVRVVMKVIIQQANERNQNA